MQYFPYGLICILLLICIIIIKRREKQVLTMRSRRRKKDKEMQEIAKRYIGKDVIMDTVSINNVDGILKEVVDNAAIIERKGETQSVNLDYVIRIREYPKNKNGKRKAVVLD